LSAPLGGSYLFSVSPFFCPFACPASSSESNIKDLSPSAIESLYLCLTQIRSLKPIELMKSQEFGLVIFALIFVAIVAALSIMSYLKVKNTPPSPQKRYKGAKKAKREQETWQLD
jgi:predicted transposase YdaD